MAYYKFARAIVEGRPVDLFNSGAMSRDFTYIDDVVQAMIRVLDRPAAGDPKWDPTRPDPASSSAPYKVYNIGNSRAEPLESLVAALERALGRKAQRRLLSMQPGDVHLTEADVSDLKRDFGWTPSTRLADGIARFVDWFKSYHEGART
jgi:UDP-glucuronate 4-epimerase